MTRFQLGSELFKSYSGSLPAKVFGNFKAMIKLEGEDTEEIKYMELILSFDTSYEDSRSYTNGIGAIDTLEALDLSWNLLTGKIPQELTRLNFLAFLNVSQNHLVGPIPQVRQFNTFENDSYGGNLDLCGVPLTKKCGTSDSSHVPQQLESKEEGESYFFSGFTWESVAIGYSCGLVVGTVMWSLMFKYRKPKWFVKFFDGLMPHKRRRPKKRAQR
ncbi:receptor-like protein 2 [Solanum tuberosum]|uniref:receptor-like protein 2 n=1 Tax=Solanum tuberosum TaxID=4113 RepID=UPI00073A274C|nr:PREDICTED: receptor-like protein 2 [Solanum tuberosum]